MWKQSIFVALTSAMVGCALPAKTVGQGTASDSDSESGSEGSEGESEGESASSMSSTDEGSSGPSMSGGSESGECVEEGCPWEPCADAACGTFCHICAPWDVECGEPGTYTVCTPSGTCEIWENWDEEACPGQGVENGFEDSLTQTGGCSDMTVFAANADATTALHLQIAGLVAEAHTAGETIMHEYAGDDPTLAIEVTYGSDLLVNTCTDVAGNEPQATEHWITPAYDVRDYGTITISVTPDLDNPPNATATVTFTGVPLRRNDPDIFDPNIVIESLTITDAAVGWLPG